MNQKKTWERTSVQGLLRNGASGRYYARWTISGKQKWVNLKTDVFPVAKKKCLEERAKVRALRKGKEAVEAGRGTVGDLIREEETRTRNNQDLKPASVVARLIGIQKLRKTWPDLETMKIADVTPPAVQAWALRFRSEGTKFTPPGAKTVIAGNSATSVNRAIDALRRILDIAVARGAIIENPVRVKPEDGSRLKKRILRSKLSLPSSADVQRLFAAMENNGARGGWGMEAADFCRFLSFTGARVGEVAGVTWSCVDWEKKTVHIRGVAREDDHHALKTETSDRFVPLFGELDGLLKKIIERRKRAAVYTESGKPLLDPTDPVFRLSECQKTIDAACKTTGVQRVTHHDFRHLFATRCIESGVDIPTVSRWLGHADGGALAMRTYGHLRQDHSAAQAAKVTFGGA